MVHNTLFGKFFKKRNCLCSIALLFIFQKNKKKDIQIWVIQIIVVQMHAKLFGVQNYLIM